MTDWIGLYEQDRRSMAAIMRDNIATDIRYGYGANWAVRQLIRVEEYEKETEERLREFRSAWNGQQLAYCDLKRRGAIA